MRRYRAFDLIVESAFDLPGAVETDAGGTADIAIVRGEAGLAEGSAALGPYRLAGDVVEFSAPGVGRYLIEAGQRIVVEGEPEGDAAMLVALLIATALPAALWMRGDMAVHACAAVPDGGRGAIAVTAPSGGGKSTLLAQWAATGAGVVADDVVRLCHANGGATASGLPGGWFVPVEGPEVRRFVAAPEAQQLAHAPLAALVDLRFGSGPPLLERLDTLASVELLLAARHRPKLPTLLGKNPTLLATCGLLAKRVPMYRLTIERDGAQSIVDCLGCLAPLTDGERE